MTPVGGLRVLHRFRSSSQMSYSTRWRDGGLFYKILRFCAPPVEGRSPLNFHRFSQRTASNVISKQLASAFFARHYILTHRGIDTPNYWLSIRLRIGF
jgi:hypothetical protein